MIPGWTTATRFSWSISRIRSIAVKAIVRPPSIPAAPPDRPVPAPRGTIGTPSSPAIRTSSTTSAVLVGKTTARGRPGMEVGRLVEAVALAVDRRRSSRRRPGSRARDRRDERVGHGSWPCRSVAAGHAPMPAGRGWSRPKSTRHPEPGLGGCRHPAYDGRMARRLPVLLGRRRGGDRPCALPAADRGHRARRRRRDIVPGSVNRSSPSSTRPTTPTCWLGWGPRKISRRLDARRSATRPAAPIDRVELNTIAARLGGIRLEPVTVDGVAVAARISDQTIVVPLGGVLPAGRHDPGPGPLPRHPAQQPDRLELAVHPGERHRRPVPLAAVGQPADRVQPAEPRRPVRDADQPVGQGPDRHRPGSSCWRRPATGSRSAPTA